VNIPVSRRERLAWVAIPLTLIGLVAAFLTIGSLGEPRAELQRIEVGEVLAESDPAAEYGSQELQLVGWYASLTDDCVAPPGEPSGAMWLERTCPLRILLAEQPASGATQPALEAIGLRIAAPTGEPFPPRSQPNGWHLLLEQLIVTGHFDDGAAAECDAARATICRDTFVVTDTDSLVH
jgi:hypothetical protein